MADPAPRLRELFAYLLLCNQIGSPRRLWDAHEQELCADLLYMERRQVCALPGVR